MHTYIHTHVRHVPPPPSLSFSLSVCRYLGAWAFVMFTFGVVKFLALTAIVGLATVYSKLC